MAAAAGITEGDFTRGGSGSTTRFGFGSVRELLAASTWAFPAESLRIYSSAGRRSRSVCLRTSTTATSARRFVMGMDTGQESRTASGAPLRQKPDEHQHGSRCSPDAPLIRQFPQPGALRLSRLQRRHGRACMTKYGSRTTVSECFAKANWIRQDSGIQAEDPRRRSAGLWDIPPSPRDPRQKCIFLADGFRAKGLRDWTCSSLSRSWPASADGRSRQPTAVFRLLRSTSRPTRGTASATETCARG